MSDLEGMAAERVAEMVALTYSFPYEGRENIQLRQWMGQCVGAIRLGLQTANTVEEKVILLSGLAMAMWQAGYEAAPKLEFVLPEGGKG